MNAVIVYESMFGNTRKVAEAVADGLRNSMDTDLVEVGAAGHADLAGAGLVVVGGPTHAHGMSRSGTRKAAADDGADAAPAHGPGVREWLPSLPRAAAGQHAACFDTRFDKPRWLVGSAAQRVAARLRARGYRLAAPPESFFVTHSSGPLAAGELDRARAWGAHLAQQLGRTPAAR